MVREGLCSIGLENRSKNRYSNILPLNDHLVNMPSGNYINASWVDLRLRSGGKYIITQGPMHPDYYGIDTTSDFWEMVFSTRSPLVICLASVEAGFSGCAKYWPDKGTSQKYGALNVSVNACNEVDGTDGLWRRSILITDLEGDTHECEHLYFKNWPNYDIATDTSSTEYLVDAARRVAVHHQNAEKARPIIVHCSGGIGRSGAFLAAVASLVYVDTTSDSWSTVSIASIVADMRARRHPWMVEGFEQFAFATHLVASGIAKKYKKK